MRKNQKQKILSALMVAGMLMTVPGCGNDTTQPSATNTQKAAEKTETKTEAKTEATETKTEATETKTEIAADTEVKTDSLLPYTGEEITFTYFWFDMGSDYSATENLPIAKTLQEKMGNIKLQLEVLPITDYYTKVPLLLASGELPDMMITFDPSTNLATYGPNGIFLDWAPLMEEYMPNLTRYSKELTMFEDMKDTEGHMYGLPIYANSEDYIMQTWLANATLLKSLNIEIPKTQDEFLEACRKVKAEMDVIPIQRRYGLTSLIDSVGLMYKNEGDRGLNYYPDEGVWDFGPTRDDSEFKNLLTFLNTMWKEGLIDHEINTMTTEQFSSNIHSGKFAFTHDYQESYSHTLGDNYVPFTKNSDFEMQVIPTPKGSGCRIGIDSAKDGKCVWAVVADAKTKHPELLASCIDIIFSDEIATLENYGIEGESYKVENGQKVFTDKVKAACNNFSGNTSLADLGANGSAWLRTFGITDTKATRLLIESPEIYEGVNKIIDMLDNGQMKARYAYGLPALTEDENTEVTDIRTPVETYLDQCVVKFIMGDMDLEKEWDTFMTNLKGYGDMDRVCEILNSKKMPKYAGNWR